jgi:hypothetical protein
MGDRALSEILKAQQHVVGRLADLADCLQARGRQHVPRRPNQKAAGIFALRLAGFENLSL